MPDPVVHITNGIPDSGTGPITTLGQTLLDGANITLGATADAAVVAGAAGSINSHLRTISRDIAGGIVLASGTNTIGLVSQAAPPWAENITQFGGSPIATGVGIGGAGIPRVTVSSDSSLSAVQSGNWDIRNITGSVPLPSGAATSAKQPAIGTSGSPAGDVLTIQGVSGMVALKVDGTGGTFPVSGTVTANQGGTWNLNNINGTISLPTGAATAAKQPTPGTAGTPSTDVLTVQGAVGMTALKVDGGPTSTTGTVTSVAAAVTNTVILVSNPSRYMASVFNDSSSANLFLILSSAAAALTNFTVRLVPNAYYELPFRYTGAINGIWDTASGNARVTELT